MPGFYLAIPCIWEGKALNAKNWRAIDRDGYAATFPRYAAQVALYQFFFNKLNPALITCVNADTCEILHFLLPFNAALAERTIERVKAIIAATQAGDLLPRAYSDPDDWRCCVCGHRNRCWGAAYASGS
jgi:hypothetical protein